MSCRSFSAYIALYVEADLAVPQSMKLEAHLALCPKCRALAEQLRETQAAIRRLQSETVDPSSLKRMRAHVLARVRQIEEQRTWFDRLAIFFWGYCRWRYAVVGGIVMTLAGAGIWQLTHQTVRPVQQLARIAASKSEEMPRPPDKCCDVVSERRGPVHTSGKVRHASKKARPAGADEQHEDVLVKILTDDPNVVIYWLIDQKTGGF